MGFLRRLWEKVSWSPGLLFLFGLDAVWVLCTFLAPFTIAPGTFAFTIGRANIVDHLDMYAQPSFNWFAKIVYTIGDLECHQLWYRSLWLNGNQMPICARDASLFLFGGFGLFWAMLTPPELTTTAGMVNAFPPRVRRWARRVGAWKFSAIVVVLGLLPAGVDGFAELLSRGQYESLQVTRVLTGVPGGLAVGLLIGMMAKAIRQFNVEYRRTKAAGTPASVGGSARRTDAPYPREPLV